MRNHKVLPVSWSARSGKASFDLLAGPEGGMTMPVTQVDLTEYGAAMQPVYALATEDGETQPALSRGGFGTLRRAGSP